MKLAAEKYISMYDELHGIPTCALRISNAYGPLQPTERGQGVVAAFLGAARAQNPVRIFGDGSIVRDYVFVQDVADAVVDLSRLASVPRVVNVGTGRTQHQRCARSRPDRDRQDVVGRTHSAEEVGRAEHRPRRRTAVDVAGLESLFARGRTSRRPGTRVPRPPRSGPSCPSPDHEVVWCGFRPAAPRPVRVPRCVHCIHQE